MFTRRPRTARVLTVLVAVALISLVSPFGLFKPDEAQAAVGDPTVPEPGRAIWREDFDKGGATLDGYTGADWKGDPITYYSDPFWNASSKSCNGWVLNDGTTRPTTAQDAGCESNAGLDGKGVSHAAWWYLRLMARELGRVQGIAESTNNVVASMTNNGAPRPGLATENNVQFRATNVVGGLDPVTGEYTVKKGHYYVAAAWFAAVHCPADNSGWAAAQQRLTLLVPPSAEYPTGRVESELINPCAGSRNVTSDTPIYTRYIYSHAWQAPADGVLLGIEITNNQLGSTGNDIAFDTPQIVDVTPVLSKDFVPNEIWAGDASALTFIVTNTSEYQNMPCGGTGEPACVLIAKEGWTFTDRLAAGLSVANPTNVQVTCYSASGVPRDQNLTAVDKIKGNAATPGDDTTRTTIAPGDTEIFVDAARLFTNEAYCEFSVDVTGAVGTYTNGPSNIDSEALSSGMTEDTTLTVLSPLSLTMSAEATYASGATNRVDEPTDVVIYTAYLTNNGDTEIWDLSVTAPDGTDNFTGAHNGTGTMPTAYTCDAPVNGISLQPGETVTCTIEYPANQGDLDDYSIQDLVLHSWAHGTSGKSVGHPDAQPVDSNQANVGLPVVRTPSLTMVKSVTPQTGVKAGDWVTYSFAVTNTGNTTILNVAIDEVSFAGTGTLSAVTCLADTLAPGASTSCAATYQVTLADTDFALPSGGAVQNVAQAVGETGGGDPVTSPEDEATFQTTSASLVIDWLTATVTDINGEKSHVDDADDVVTFRTLLRNDGNVDLTDVVINLNDLFGPSFTGAGPLDEWTCDWPDGTTHEPPGGLAVGETAECWVVYDVTLADLDAIDPFGISEIGLTIQAVGKDPVEADVPSNVRHVAVDEVAHPALQLVKTVVDEYDQPVASFVREGTVLTYWFDVINKGNQTIDDLAIVETYFAGEGVEPQPQCPVSTLVPGESTRCWATYTVVAGDVAIKDILNVAQAEGTHGGEEIDPSEEAWAEFQTGVTELVMTIEADVWHLDGSPNSLIVREAGDIVTYTFTVTNTGTETLTDVRPATAGEGFTGQDGVLGPIMCIWPDNGFNDESGATTAPGLNLADYQGTLESGDLVTCTQTYEASTTDLDTSTAIWRWAQAVGTDQNGTDEFSNQVEAVVTELSAPALRLVKTVSAVGGQFDASGNLINVLAGQTITFYYELANVGNQSLDYISITDTPATGFTGTGSLGSITCPGSAYDPVNSGRLIVLAQGQKETCWAQYTVTDEDAVAGIVTNWAKATGESVLDETPVEDGDGTVFYTVPEAALELTLTGRLTDEHGVLKPAVTNDGDLIEYTLIVTNMGNGPADDLRLVEIDFHSDELGGTYYGDPLVWVCTPVAEGGTLAAGASTTCTATYRVVQEDIDEGTGEIYLEMQATGLGPAPLDPTTPGDRLAQPTITSNNDDVTIAESFEPSVKLTKTANPSGNVKVGEQVTYTFTVTNDGNMTLTDVLVHEGGFIGGTWIDGLFTGNGTLINTDCPVIDGSGWTLAPEETATCTATYRVHLLDAVQATVNNTATVSAWHHNHHDPDPENRDDQQIFDSATATVYPVGEAALLIDLEVLSVRHADATTETCIDLDEIGTPVEGCTIVEPGDVVDYRVTVTNDGSLPVDGLALRFLNNPPASLTCTLYDGTGADLGTVTGNSDPSTDKSYRVTLPVGGQLVCEYSTTVTQADIDAGSLFTEQAQANGTATGYNYGIVTEPMYVVSPPDIEAVPIAQNPRLTLTGSVLTTRGDPATDVPAYFDTNGNGLIDDDDEGQVVYTFLIENTGNVTLYGVGMPAPEYADGSGTVAITCEPSPVTGLPPGGMLTCTVVKRISVNEAWKWQDGVDLDGIATGKTLYGQLVSDTAAVEIDTLAEARLAITSLTAEVSHDGTLSPGNLVRAAGDRVRYTAVVENPWSGDVFDLGLNDFGASLSWTCTPHDLGDALLAFPYPEAAVTVCTAEYVVTQADLDAGQIDLGLQAFGLDANDGDVLSNLADVSVFVVSAPALTLEKRVSPSTDVPAGTQVTYYFAVKNTGNVTLTSLNIVEGDFTGSGNVSAVTCPVTTLAPGTSTTCTAVYTVTIADVAQGTVTNTATARAKDPSGEGIESPPGSAVLYPKPEPTPTPSPDPTPTPSPDPSPSPEPSPSPSPDPSPLPTPAPEPTPGPSPLRTPAPLLLITGGNARSSRDAAPGDVPLPITGAEVTAQVLVVVMLLGAGVLLLSERHLASRREAPCRK
ncbi:MAG: DUF11 domain-containing protein [Promicromonosporaceae bacterium]|nr:DUF11 domain-containing protein [Promicromonosporaceae bacterium]